MTLKEYREYLLDKPSCITDCCAVCGNRAHDKHHVLPKGMGGVGKALDRRIPLMRLCGFGNNSGCHGLVHSHHLHIYWDEEKGGWVYLLTDEPMSDWKCWDERKDEYAPVPGWHRLSEGK